METPSSASSLEKLAGALASFLFFVPLLMNNVKTPFVVKYMKQGFMINVIEILLSVVASFLWMLGWLFSLVNLALFIASIFLALQAFAGKDYVIALLYENAEKLIQTMNISNLFTPGK